MDSPDRSPAQLGPLARATDSRRDVARCVVLFVVVSAGFLLFENNFIGTSLTLAVPYAIVVAGMVLQIGYGRQLALSQVVFMALGAYGVAILNTKMGFPVAAAIVVVVGASIVVALAIAAVVARVGGLAIGLVTLFLVVMLSDSIIYSSYLGGTTGMGPVQPLVSAASAGTTQIESGVVTAAVLAAATLLVVRILRDDVGAEISLLGASSRAAASLGIRAAHRRVEIFVLGSVLATLGGALFAALQGFVSPKEFGPSAELTILLMLFLGGQASVYCAVLGPFLIEAMPGVSSVVADNITLIEGVLLTVLLTALPMGIGGLWQSFVRRSPSPRAQWPVQLRPVQARLRSVAAGLLGPMGTPKAAAAQASAVRAAAHQEAVSQASAVQAAPAGMIAETLHGRLQAGSRHILPAGGEHTSTERPRGEEVTGVDFRQTLPVALRERVAGDSGSLSGPEGAGAPPPQGAPALEVRGVTKTFGGVAAVRDVTIQIAGPGIFCIVGPNGAGKSTLLELLSGGYFPDSGSVHFHGRDVTRMPAWQRARLGMTRTFQNVELCNSLTPLDNVAMAALHARRGILRPVLKGVMGQAREKAMAAMGLLGISEVADLPEHRLTLAQERNVELARALVGQPRLVLLDEPASGLSEVQRHAFGDLLLQLGERLPIVLVEHDLSLVARLAKVVFVLVEGSLIYQGGVEGFESDPSVGYHLRGLVSS